MWNLKKKSSWKQIGGCQRKRVEEIGEGGPNAQTPSCKISKCWGCLVQRGDYSSIIALCV